MDSKAAADLLERYYLGKCTPEEISLIEDWYETLQTNDQNMTAAQKARLSVQLKQEIDAKTGRRVDSKTTRLWRGFGIKPGVTILAAAAAVAMVVFGVWFFNAPDPIVNRNSAIVNHNDIAPGKNGATITLANGKIIELSDAKGGVVIGDDKLVYSDGSPLSPQGGSLPEGESNAVAETAKGQTYEFTLPDGTKVWLNAASKLEIPSSFSGTDVRKIKLEGEAYFEVAKDKKRPFIVASGGQEVKVLGTHFNINAYKDEPNIKTTLLEGSVEIIAGSSRAVIRPGEQGSFKSNEINVADVNVNTVIDWKNGTFRFKNESLTSILRKVSRWYDVKIIYESDPTKMPTFSGAISRLENVSGILQMLEETSDVKFTIDGKTIRVE
ncbi:FecR family protein [Pedobacter frigoris]|nr:FecR domain-containing protein [Pedobacter frigoris]